MLFVTRLGNPPLIFSGLGIKITKTGTPRPEFTECAGKPVAQINILFKSLLQGSLKLLTLALYKIISNADDQP